MQLGCFFCLFWHGDVQILNTQKITAVAVVADNLDSSQQKSVYRSHSYITASQSAVHLIIFSHLLCVSSVSNIHWPAVVVLQAVNLRWLASLMTGEIDVMFDFFTTTPPHCFCFWTTWLHHHVMMVPQLIVSAALNHVSQSALMFNTMPTLCNISNKCISVQSPVGVWLYMLLTSLSARLNLNFLNVMLLRDREYIHLKHSGLYLSQHEA